VALIDQARKRSHAVQKRGFLEILNQRIFERKVKERRVPIRMQEGGGPWEVDLSDTTRPIPFYSTTGVPGGEKDLTLFRVLEKTYKALYLS